MRWDVIDENTIRVLRRLGGTKLCERYVLVGGIALALLLGHRRSRDLDFFSAEPADRLHAGWIL